MISDQDIKEIETGLQLLCDCGDDTCETAGVWKRLLQSFKESQEKLKIARTGFKQIISLQQFKYKEGGLSEKCNDISVFAIAKETLDKISK